MASATCPGSAPGRPLARRPAEAIWSGAPPPAAGRSRPATCSSRRGYEAPPRSCTTPASIPQERLEIARTRAGQRPLHGADRVPRDRQARDAQPAARAAHPGRRRRGAQPRGPARLQGRDRPRDPRRLRPDRDRPADRRCRSASRSAPARWAARSPASTLDGRSTANWCSTDPTTDPTFFVGYLDGRAPAPDDEPLAHRRPRPPGRGRLPVLRGPHRRRDHLRGLPDRAVRGRVRAGLPRGGRRSGGRRRARRRARPVVRAVVVLRDGFAPSDDLATELQDHVKHETAPYKYPRIVDFAPELPKTASGKVQRAATAADA